jgi:hypothetical protein
MANLAIEPRVGSLNLMMCRVLLSLLWNLESLYGLYAPSWWKAK